mmetsp:Transcript_48929/g.116319  ORF Transcript_48929/g.116319 Transcript_48929/m.116319 type:complete len:236 (+) Transcript_48929:260-967(+)
MAVPKMPPNVPRWAAPQRPKKIPPSGMPAYSCPAGGGWLRHSSSSVHAANANSARQHRRRSAAQYRISLGGVTFLALPRLNCRHRANLPRSSKTSSFLTNDWAPSSSEEPTPVMAVISSAKRNFKPHQTAMQKLTKRRKRSVRTPRWHLLGGVQQRFGETRESGVEPSDGAYIGIRATLQLRSLSIKSSEPERGPSKTSFRLSIKSSAEQAVWNESPLQVVFPGVGAVEAQRELL